MVDPPVISQITPMVLLIVIFPTGICSLKDPLLTYWNSDSRAAKVRVLSYFHIPEVEDTHVPEETGTPDRLSLGSEEANSLLSLQRLWRACEESRYPLALMAAISLSCVRRCSSRVL